MKSIIISFKNLEFYDKFLAIFIALIPLSLAISIFLADFFTSISGIIFIYILLFKEKISLFKEIKKEIIFFAIFFFVILLSLIFTDYKEDAFMPSFFYFRYFLLSLIIFYLLKKYDDYFKIFFYSTIISISIVILDSYFQQFIGFNLFGYAKIGSLEKDSLIYLTSFFNDEKKLGSYLVRFLPLILSLIYFYKTESSIYLEMSVLILIGIIVYLSSERTALFLLFVIYFFYILISQKKIYFLIITTLVFIFLFSQDSRLNDKYINYTLQQTGLINFFKKTENETLNFDENKIPRYYSEEHENLAYTGIVIFKNNIFFGSGIKSFYQECNNLLSQDLKNTSNKRNNKLTCSTHPHSTYIQILSEIGIIGFLLVLFIFFKLLKSNLLLIFKQKSKLVKSYFFINLSIIINIMPFIPSGSFFNNWISIMIFFPIGFWLFIRFKTLNENF